MRAGKSRPGDTARPTQLLHFCMLRMHRFGVSYKRQGVPTPEKRPHIIGDLLLALGHVGA